MNWKKMMAVGLAAVSMMVFVTGCGGDAKKANTELPKKVVMGLDLNCGKLLHMTGQN